MGRKHKKWRNQFDKLPEKKYVKPQYDFDFNDGDISDEEYNALLRWRFVLLKLMEPIIPFNVGLKVHQYKCVEGGYTGVQAINYVEGEMYNVRKSRFKVDLVEINGMVHNTRTGRVFMHKSWFTVPVENCKKYLKQVDHV